LIKEIRSSRIDRKVINWRKSISRRKWD
jgi:hypothetical protein